MRRDQAGHFAAVPNTVTRNTSRVAAPGWLWAAGTNTARPSSGGLETGPSGIPMGDSMSYPPPFRPAATAGDVLAGGAR